MSISRVAMLALWLAAGGHDPSALSADGWREFKSRTQGFTVRYPESWHRVDGFAQRTDSQGLDIINFRKSERVTGVVLKPSGAEIQVSAAPKNVRTMQDWVRLDLADTPPAEDNEVPVRSPQPGGCTKLRRVTWRSDVSGQGKALLFYTAYYCSTDGRLFSILLSNWEGNPNQEQLQKIALAIASSLRSRWTSPHS